MPLLEIWESARDTVLRMTIQQIVSVAGDGNIKDGSDCSHELRAFFQRVDSGSLEGYAATCLDNPFKDSGFVLQDVVNEVGRRLGFDVTFGLYRGKQTTNNFDGVWHGDDW